MTPLRWPLLAVVAVLVLCGHVASAQSLCDTPQCECDDTQSQVRCSCRKVPQESQEIVLVAQGPGHVPRVATDIKVTQCDVVKISSMAFDGAKSLWSVDIGSVRRLEMADGAFGWSENGGGGSGQPQQQQHSQQYQYQYHHQGLTVTITNVTVPEVPSYAFRGRLKSITFVRTRVDAIRPFAFGSLTGTTGRIEFRDTVFGQVEQQAFKKFTVNEFVMKGCRFQGPVPSRMLTEITVHDELRLEEVEFTVVRSYAFKVHGPKVFRVQYSRADCVQRGAFEVTCRGPAFVEDNAFRRLERGAFAAVSVDARKVAEADYQEFVFENNTVAEFEDDALVFDTKGFRPRLDWLIVGRACGCDDRWRTDLVAFSADYPRHTERVAWTVEQVAWCAQPTEEGTTSAGRLVKAIEYDRAHCPKGSASGAGGFRLTFVAVVAVAALTGALISWIWYKKKRRRSQWTNVPTSSPLKTRSILKSSGGGNGSDKHVMVMPEGKTYRETELHVIVERTGSADGQCRSTTNYHQRTQPLTSDL